VDDRHALYQDISNCVPQAQVHLQPDRDPSRHGHRGGQNLTAALKGKMPHYLQESSLADLTRLSRLFFDAADAPESDQAPHRPVVPEPEAVVDPEPRRSPRLSTHVDQDGRITALPSLPPAAPLNSPIPCPRYIEKALEATPRRRQKIRDATLLFRPEATTLRVEAVRAPAPRVAPRQSLRLAAPAPRVAPPAAASATGGVAASSKGGHGGPSHRPRR
jgi:hypothetical protein